MSFPIDHDLHIHTHLSQCSSDPEQTVERIVAYARENSLGTVAITDHMWDAAAGAPSAWYEPQNVEHVRRHLPLPPTEDVRVLFGCETDMDRHGRIGLSRANYDLFDFIIVPTTHMHMKGFTVPEDTGSAEAKATLWVERFDALLRSDLPMKRTGLAHPMCACIEHQNRELYLNTLRCLPTAAMQRLFSAAAERGLGIEINADDMNFSENETDIVLRPLRIAKDCGCKFYLGSDAHHPRDFSRVRAAFLRGLDLLQLTEADIFRPAR